MYAELFTIEMFKHAFEQLQGYSALASNITDNEHVGDLQVSYTRSFHFSFVNVWFMAVLYDLLCVFRCVSYWRKQIIFAIDRNVCVSSHSSRKNKLYHEKDVFTVNSLANICHYQAHAIDIFNFLHVRASFYTLLHMPIHTLTCVYGHVYHKQDFVSGKSITCWL